jgi:hypothetical protein
MILAGGALTAIACASSSSDSDHVNIPCCNGGGDPCCSLGCLGAADPNGAMYGACEKSLAECESMDGSFSGNADGSFECVVAPTGPIDAEADVDSVVTDGGAPEAGPADTGTADTGTADAGTGPGDAGDASDAARD